MSSSHPPATRAGHVDVPQDTLPDDDVAKVSASADPRHRIYANGSLRRSADPPDNGAHQKR
jgi:hypothetical protein